MNKQFGVYLCPWLLCIGMILVLSCSLLSAQTIISGDIAGNVSDPTGAAVADAMVTLTSLESGAVQSIRTDNSGSFRFPLLRPGEYRLERQGEMLRCPWHGWEFDIKTGQSWCHPESVKARTYNVEVVPGEVLAKGPFVAETVPVAVEQNYVVLDL